MTKQFLFALVSLCISITSFAGTKVTECHGRPEFLSESRASALKGIESLPKLVFVGRSADYYVESKNRNFRIWGQQSFTRPESKIVCASFPASGAIDLERGFSIYGPTLMDLTGEQNVGDSFWQFHLMSNPRQLGIWNQKSRLFSNQKDIESQLFKLGAQVRIFQIAHNEFEMILTRESEKFIETLSIRFDTVSNLH